MVPYVIVISFKYYFYNFIYIYRADYIFNLYNRQCPAFVEDFIASALPVKHHL
nr:MAG TPA: hypothetical protein [Crassvirales sp.]